MDDMKRKIPIRVLELVSYEIQRARIALKNLSLVGKPTVENPRDREVRLASMRVHENNIAEFQQFLKDFDEEAES